MNRWWGTALSVLSACGAASSSGHDGAVHPASPLTTERAGAQSASGEPSVPSAASLAARAPSVAPGMREVARHEGGPEAADVIRADERDLCVRLLFAADAPVDAALVDAGGSVLAEAADSTGGAIGERGPVCVRRGAVVRVRFQSGASRPQVRWVAWASK